MKQVLFVDDDPGVLDGLRRMLRSMRNEWKMEFVGSGAEALDAFSKTPFDIVVSDMKMPGMDGADLLAEVKQRHPDTIRLILSGHSSSEMIMKSVGVAHQYLAKPCDADTVKETISRALALRALLSNDHLASIASGIQNLPSIPSVYQQIVSCLQDPDAGLADVGQIIGKDIGMTSKILQLVNSAFFGLSTPVSSIDRAVSFIGLSTISSMVLGHGVFSRYEPSGSGGLDIEELWKHSTDTATIAKILAKSEKMSARDVEDAYLAGMLHEVGHLVLATELTDKHREMMEAVAASHDDSETIEREMLGTTHAEIGAYLLGLWGLPNNIVEAVAYHERPEACASSEFGLVGIVHLANRIARMRDVSHPDDPMRDIDSDYVQRMGMSERWPVWQAACQAALCPGGDVA